MYCFVDYRITQEELSNLEKLNLIPIKIPQCKKLYSAIDGHVDIQMSIIHNKIIFQRDIDSTFLKSIEEKGIDYVLSENSLDETYPKDIILNALITDSFILHNLNFTDKNLLDNSLDLHRINVKQGYSNCSTLKVSNTAFITSDIKISKALEDNGNTVLYVPPGDILLPPLNYGFIGGVGGLINPSTMVFFGDLNTYKYGKEVIAFLALNNVKPVFLKSGPLHDRGSIFVL